MLSFLISKCSGFSDLKCSSSTLVPNGPQRNLVKQFFTIVIDSRLLIPFIKLFIAISDFFFRKNNYHYTKLTFPIIAYINAIIGIQWLSNANLMTQLTTNLAIVNWQMAVDRGTVSISKSKNHHLLTHPRRLYLWPVGPSIGFIARSWFVKSVQCKRDGTTDIYRDYFHLLTSLEDNHSKFQTYWIITLWWKRLKTSLINIVVKVPPNSMVNGALTFWRPCWGFYSRIHQ